MSSITRKRLQENVFFLLEWVFIIKRFYKPLRSKQQNREIKAAKWEALCKQSGASFSVSLCFHPRLVTIPQTFEMALPATFAFHWSVTNVCSAFPSVCSPSYLHYPQLFCFSARPTPPLAPAGAPPGPPTATAPPPLQLIWRSRVFTDAVWHAWPPRSVRWASAGRRSSEVILPMREWWRREVKTPLKARPACTSSVIACALTWG